jgi:hypothetical protein
MADQPETLQDMKELLEGRDRKVRMDAALMEKYLLGTLQANKLDLFSYIMSQFRDVVRARKSARMVFWMILLSSLAEGKDQFAQVLLDGLPIFPDELFSEAVGKFIPILGDEHLINRLSDNLIRILLSSEDFRIMLDDGYNLGKLAAMLGELGVNLPRFQVELVRFLGRERRTILLRNTLYLDIKKIPLSVLLVILMGFDASSNDVKEITAMPHFWAPMNKAALVAGLLSGETGVTTNRLQQTRKWIMESQDEMFAAIAAHLLVEWGFDHRAIEGSGHVNSFLQNMHGVVRGSIPAMVVLGYTPDQIKDALDAHLPPPGGGDDNEDDNEDVQEAREALAPYLANPAGARELAAAALTGLTGIPIDLARYDLISAVTTEDYASGAEAIHRYMTQWGPSPFGRTIFNTMLESQHPEYLVYLVYARIDIGPLVGDVLGQPFFKPSGTKNWLSRLLRDRQLMGDEAFWNEYRVGEIRNLRPFVDMESSKVFGLMIFFSDGLVTFS